MPPQHQRTARLAAATVLCSSIALAASAQNSDFALRFFNTDSDPLDRVRIPIDDNGPGPNQSQPNDLGADSFTIETWVRGSVLENFAPNAGGDVESASDDWLLGDVIVDRDILSGSQRDWGISIAGGFVRFGTGSGDSGDNQPDTIEGNVDVLDDRWHHIACTRDIQSGIKRIYVDGQLDFESAAGVSTDNLSYPNAGVPNSGSALGHFLVLGARKHLICGTGESFKGFLDEVRMWNVPRSAMEIAASFDQVVDFDSAGLVGYYRFE